nr:MAG TPA: hypothetical protein [Caudoviricetes sp.]
MNLENVIILILILLIFMLTVIVHKVGHETVQEPPQEQAPPMMPFMTKLTDLHDALSLLVDLEFTGVVTIPKITQDLPLITDFEYYHKEIANNVLNALTPAFYNNAYALGVTKTYVDTQVIRLSMYKILTYMGENNLALK